MNQTPLWQPDENAISKTHMHQFMQQINKKFQQELSNYFQLQQWSLSNTENFWQAVAEYSNILFKQPADTILKNSDKMPGAQWFPNATLNFAENLLRFRDEKTAIIYADEQGQRQQLSYQQLFDKVTQLANYLKQQGLQSGDRVAGMLANCPETIIAMLACASLGAIWSACSPDFGLDGLIQRFEQIEPKILFASAAHFYGGKTYNHIEKIKKLQAQLKNLQQTIIINAQDDCLPDNSIAFDDCQGGDDALEFPAQPFNHPLYVLYSSGTTGAPKCLVHGAGGTLLEHLKELKLHTDIKREDRFFFFTTCGWMMWNWLVSGLALGTTLVLYEGSPFYPNNTVLIDLIDELKITKFGVGAKYIESMHKQGLTPKKTHSLNSLKTILTTGSPLVPESFDYIYEKFKTNVQVSSISGGSDIIGCFALGNPMVSVYRGQLQSLSLGLHVNVFDDSGQPLSEQKGELVCTAPFPSMPIYFYNDPNGEKYQHAYFDTYPNIWAHSDYAEITAQQGLIIYGRADTTLNPKGIRIGTAEIYRQLENIEEILDAAAVGQRWQGDERIILFVVLKADQHLSADLIENVKKQIRKNLSPHHVPAKIIQIADIPRTISGKTVELAIKKIIHNQPVKNSSALANPEALDYYKDLEELKN